MPIRPVFSLLATTILAALFATLLAPGAATARAEDPEPDREVGRDHKLMLVFDSSGSMEEPDDSGTSKLEAAKVAFARTLDDLDDDRVVGLRVYGSEVRDADDPAACTDSRLAVPPAPLDDETRDAMGAEIAALRPYGETPIAYSLRQAAKDLGDSGHRTIILVSDGEERCDPDPCATAEKISGLGIDIKIDVVGMGVPPKAARQLRCIADAGNGTFYEVDDGDELTTGLNRLSERAFRPFKVDGEAVQGVSAEDLRQEDQGKGGERRAPVLTAGQYVDSAPANADDIRYYRLRRTMENSTLHVGASARPAAGLDVAVLRLSIESNERIICGHGVGTETVFARANPVVSATVSSLRPAELTASGETGGAGETDPACATSDVLLRIDQGGYSGGGETLGDGSMEIVVVEEPAVTDPAGLPEPYDPRQPWEEIGEASGWDDSVVPGASFSDAPRVEPGGYRTSLFGGEVQFFRIRLKWGQQLRTQVRVPTPDPDLAARIDYPQGIHLKVMGPTRGDAELPSMSQSQALLVADGPTEARSMIPEVRYANRDGYDRSQWATTVPGDYYVAVALGSSETGTGAREASGPGAEPYLVPYELVLESVGTAGTGAPTYVGGARPVGPGVEGVGGSGSDGGGDGTGRAGEKGEANRGSAQSADDESRRAAGDAPALSERVRYAAVAAAVCVLSLVVVWVVRRRRRTAGDSKGA